MLRTHTCGELDKKDVRKKVELAGWVQARRDHGGLIFIDLRDRYGLTQIVFDPKVKKAFSIAEKLRREDVIAVKGVVRPRRKGMANPKLKTGKIEVEVNEVELLNKAETPPVEIEDRIEASEEMRLKYRYLDLRRPVMQKHLLMRHGIAQAAREYFNKNNFLEIETPCLVRSTPEGARDYIVPSRVNLGKFYALPQSPQLYKQILMIAGCDRYYQFARCLRDEDLRIDRQPEHTQMDFEMSFVTAEDIREFVEGLYKHVFKEIIGIKLGKFPVLSYKEAMGKYGTDKPDLRFGLELVDVGEIVRKSEFKVFTDVLANKGAEKSEISGTTKRGVVKCINAKKARFGKAQIEELIDFALRSGAKGLVWMKIEGTKLQSSVVKFFSKKVQDELVKAMKAKDEDYLFFVADKEEIVNDVMSRLREEIARRLNLIKEGDFKFCWVTDFPLFKWNEDEDRWEPEHHMFTMPKPEFVKDLEKRPGEVIGDLWDLTLNGIELGSGSMRVTNPELQERIMRFIGLSKEEAENKFGFLLNAYKYAAPPHGGMGLGFDRLVALMCGTNDIREVIAFPKNKAAQCLMDRSPSEVPDEHLKELHVRVEKIKEKH